MTPPLLGAITVVVFTTLREGFTIGEVTNALMLAVGDELGRLCQVIGERGETDVFMLEILWFEVVGSSLATHTHCAWIFCKERIKKEVALELLVMGSKATTARSTVDAPKDTDLIS